jgi:heme exporter protein A
MTALLRFDNVACRRGGRMLFEDLDLEIGAGEAVQVTGPNGSGKSSMLRMAAGLLRPERGALETSRVALADDRLALDSELPLGRALGFWSAAEQRDEDLRGTMHDLGLDHLLEVPVRLLSSGQQKRAILARVAASAAPLWLLDEPLNALDSDGAVRLSNIIDRQLKRGGAVLAASHVPLPGEWRTLEIGR